MSHGRGWSLRSKKRKIPNVRICKWWHRIFYFIFNLAIINSFIPWQVKKRNRRPANIPYSISSLAHRRIFLKKRKRRPASCQAKCVVVPDDVRLASVGNHMPNMVSDCRRCRKCSRKGQEKRTRCVCGMGYVHCNMLHGK
ncbi:piggyBac transposable element-derived protein 4 [Trichonephila clavipes]|nr:piggyBac transposable element-derived protein 4 [Trichonephila clavipes]